MADKPERIMIADRDYITKQAAFIRGLIRESDLFIVKIDEDDADAMLVAAFCLGGAEPHIEWDNEGLGDDG